MVELMELEVFNKKKSRSGFGESGTGEFLLNRS
jgi:hypothetical protein